MSLIRSNFGFYDSLILGLVDTGGFTSSVSTDNRIEIYSGTMLDDANDWVVGGPGSPSNLLVTFQDFKISQYSTPTSADNLDVQDSRFTYNFTPDPGTVNATASGTAAWYAMYNVGGTDAVVFGALLGDISLSGGNGSMHLDSLTLVIGEPVQLLHWGVRFQA